MNLKFAELHTPLFLAGINFTMKLDVSRRAGLKLKYERKDQELLVTWQDQLAIIPMGNVVSMVPYGENEAIKAPIHIIPEPRAKVKAQASTPAGIKND